MLPPVVAFPVNDILCPESGSCSTLARNAGAMDSIGQPAAAEAVVRLTDGLRITYDPQDARYVDRTVSIIRTARPQLHANLGLSSADTIHIHIAGCT